MEVMARIVAVRQTGAAVGGRRVIELDLTVAAPAGAPPYPVTHRLAVAQIAVAARGRRPCSVNT